MGWGLTDPKGALRQLMNLGDASPLARITAELAQTLGRNVNTNYVQ